MEALKISQKNYTASGKPSRYKKNPTGTLTNSSINEDLQGFEPTYPTFHLSDEGRYRPISFEDSDKHERLGIKLHGTATRTTSHPEQIENFLRDVKTGGKSGNPYTCDGNLAQIVCRLFTYN